MSVLKFQNISMEFPGVRALNNVSFSIEEKGTVIGILGENGAGKSTLLKILGGIYTPTSGELCINGEKVAFHSAADSLGRGISIIHQEIQLIDRMSVAENLQLKNRPSSFGFIQWKTMYAQAQKVLDEFRIPLNARDIVEELPLGLKQLVEISKSLINDSNIIAFDEPTSSLSEKDVAVLFTLIRELLRRGKTIIYITHRMKELFEICNEVYVFKDGALVSSYPVRKEENILPQLIKDMTGRNIGEVYTYWERPIGETVFEVKELCGRHSPKPNSFYLKKGEILGFYGLIGSGRSELMRTIFAEPILGGEIFLDGQKFRGKTPHDAIKNGLVFCTEDRKRDGIITRRSVQENILISCRRDIGTFNFFIQVQKEMAVAQDYIDKLSIRTPNAYKEISLLSGGNQQKVILARWLAEQNIKVFILDEPTRGIDVGAKRFIYELLFDLSEQGFSIIVVSSELPEVLGISDRLYIMKDGSIISEFIRSEFSESQILKEAFKNEGG